MWLEVRARRRGTTAKLQPKFEGPYRVKIVYPGTLTYHIDKGTRGTTVNECRLKRFRGELERNATSEPQQRQPGPRGIPVADEESETSSSEDEGYMVIPRPPPPPAPNHPRSPPPEPRAPPAETTEPPAEGRPRRDRRMPIRYRDYQCDAFYAVARGASVGCGSPAATKCAGTGDEWSEQEYRTSSRDTLGEAEPSVPRPGRAAASPPLPEGAGTPRPGITRPLPAREAVVTIQVNQVETYFQEAMASLQLATRQMGQLARRLEIVHAMRGLFEGAIRPGSLGGHPGRPPGGGEGPVSAGPGQGIRTPKHEEDGYRRNARTTLDDTRQH